MPVDCHPVTVLRLLTTVQLQYDPTVFRMPFDGSHHQVMINIIEEPFDIKVEHPVILPATFSCLPYSIQCRFARSITIRIGMKMIFQFRFKLVLDDRLSNSVGYCRDSQRPHTSVTFRYFYTQYRWWKVTAWGEPIPEFVKIVFQIIFKFFDRLSIDTSSKFRAIGLKLCQ